MPAPAPDPSRRTGGAPDDDPSDRHVDPDPDLDAATARLRSLLQPADPWWERLDLRRVADRLADVGPGRAVGVLAAAVALGVGAFVVAGPGRSSSVDPVQVLPRADPASADDPPPAGPAGPPGTTSSGDAPPGSGPSRISAHAAGAVAVAGVHQLPEGARVADLIAAAGGLSADADPDRINLAAPVRDGERVYVPRRGEVSAPEVVAGGGGGDPSGPAGPSGPASGTGAGGGPPAPGDRVDLNRADADALDALPGIGPTTADAILRHRAEHGPFRTVDDLQEVPGIGPAKLAQLRDLVRIG